MSAAADAGLIRQLFATPAAADRHADLLEAAGVRPHLVTEQAAAALSETVTPQGLVAVADLPEAELGQVLQAPPRRPGARIVVLLVEARDPGNAGTVIRSADAAGADCVVLSGASVDPWSGKCVRASAGSVLHLPVIDAVTTDEAVTALRASGCRIVAADGRAETVLQTPSASAALTGHHAWAFGNEAHGLPEDLLRIVDVAIRVPVYGRAESLNLAAAAAVCLYESARVAQVAGAAAAGGGEDAGR